MVGRTLNHYRVDAKLGAGGSGEVYRATDTVLGREVAIKVLSRRLVQDPVHSQRLRREARTLGSFNHPHIASVYGLEECEGETFIAMEFVPGQTLQELLAGKRLERKRALEIAAMLAAALEAAHDSGIVHRDLKPANIKITPNGALKVLDFGLATNASAFEITQTITVEPPSGHTVSGTPGYMSPEQLQGEPVDYRADIWAYGCIVFELFSGTRAFAGRTVTEILTATLTREPDSSVLPLPAGDRVRKVVHRCLEKDARRRYHHIADARLDLEEDPEVIAPVALKKTRRPLFWILSSAAVTVAALAAGWILARSGFTEQQPWRAELLAGPPAAIGPRISPDGQTLAFQTWVNGQNQVGILNPSSGYWNVLTDQRTEGSIMDLSWSSDGARILYDRFGTGVYSIPREGGEPRRILDRGLGPQAIPDGSFLVTIMNDQRQNQLHRFWPETQRLEALPVLLPATAEAWAPPVRVFPDGKEAAFFGSLLTAPEAANQLYAIDLESKKARRLAPSVSIRPATEYFALSISSSGRSVLVDSPEADLHRVIEVPRDGGDGARALLSLTTAPWFMDTAKDGSIYVDQVSRPSEILLFNASGGSPQRVAMTAAFVNYFRGGILPLPNGRALVSSTAGNRSRLLMLGANARLLPFIDTVEETSGPTALLGASEVAFIQGSGPARRIAVAAISERRVVRRLGTPPGDLTAMAAASDGRWIYCVVSRELWRIPAGEGSESEPQKIGTGDGVAVDPASGDLIVQVFAADGSYRLLRRSADGSRDHEIRFTGGSFITYPVPLSPRAVAPDGRILVHGGTTDTWNFRIGVINPIRGTVEVLPTEYEGDPALPGWTDDGRIISLGLNYRQNLWRFRPAQTQ
jgi:tRNA A-37 threonylcarbamoyl transferase component Bud32